MIEAATAQIRKERDLSIFQNVYEYATVLVPALVIAPRYFAGEIEFGVISQASMAFNVIRSAVSAARIKPGPPIGLRGMSSEWGETSGSGSGSAASAPRDRHR